MVILAAELLKRSKQFIEDGVSPQLIIRAYSKACEEVIFQCFFFALNCGFVFVVDLIVTLMFNSTMN